jgi:spermidine synthase
MRPRLSPFVLLFAATVFCAQAPKSELIYDRKSEFNHIQVRRDSDGLVSLVFADSPRPATQTALYPERPHELMLPYARAMSSAFLVQPKPKDVLIIGLGGGALPSFLRRHFPDTRVTVVELDPQVIDVARRFFGFKEDDKVRAVAGDGRKFIETTDQKYDLIMLDAYGPDSIPRALATREFLQAVKRRLAEGGIVAANVPGPTTNDLYDRMLKTYEAVFPIESLHVIKAPEWSVQQTVVAMPPGVRVEKQTLLDRAAELEKRAQLNFDLAKIVEDGYRTAPTIPAQTKALVDGEKE